MIDRWAIVFGLLLSAPVNSPLLSPVSAPSFPARQHSQGERGKLRENTAMEAGSKICSEGAQSTSAAAQIADEEAQCQLLQRRIAEAKRRIAEAKRRAAEAKRRAAEERALRLAAERRIAEAKRCIAELVDNEAHRLNNAA